ncbi:GDP-D-glucose phosphorylase 1 isoform X2 [Camponotus floridanus]|uniref:GDP-D-glucose phosphorylase 1 isoform X2 n=1 Tax=Camponotus floridanus TaxID=104421 RepID=UPI00059D343C|nr:GDP-D-glucose phosphorylase 1 isoform X2 [Camponotus floridanus]
MLSHRQIPTFFYDAKDFNIIIKLNKEQESQFDNILQQTWKQAEEAKAFRYILNIRSSKSLKGEYRFLAQLNPERAQCRRAPESVTSMLQPFNSIGFNFTKLAQQEILFDIGNGDTNDIIAINASPLEQGHCLVLTERLKCLPQIMTEYSLYKVTELCLLSNSWSLRAIFNSLCAHASVNHLHWHLYYLKYEMLLEYIDLCSYTSNVYLLINYPAKGFCLKLSSFKNIRDFVSQTFLIVNYLQSHQVAHNVYITRAKSGLNDDLYNDIRIYIWARKPSPGIKDTTAFIPAVCELFGHLSIRVWYQSNWTILVTFFWNPMIHTDHITSKDKGKG